MDLIRDRDGDLVGAWEVSSYMDGRSRKNWLRITERFTCYIEAEYTALLMPIDLEPVITRMGDGDNPLETYNRRFYLTQAGVEELREFLIDNLKAHEPVTDELVLAWADYVIDSLEADNGPRIKISARDSITGNPVNFQLSNGGWVSYFAKD